jgi:hypothetical protein
MGQAALGLRNLLVKAAIFVVLASLLAWALGGTLWPRAEVADHAAVPFGGAEWFWRLSVGGRERGEARWTLMRRSPGSDARPFDERTFAEVAGPAVAGAALYVAARAPGADAWTLGRIAATGGAAGAMEEALRLPDRLAVEQQLARLGAGLPLQDPADIARQRPAVIDPAAPG